jgi:hypothetical protein
MKFPLPQFCIVKQHIEVVTYRSVKDKIDTRIHTHFQVLE